LSRSRLGNGTVELPQHTHSAKRSPPSSDQTPPSAMDAGSRLPQTAPRGCFPPMVSPPSLSDDANIPTRPLHYYSRAGELIPPIGPPTTVGSIPFSTAGPPSLGRMCSVTPPSSSESRRDSLPRDSPAWTRQATAAPSAVATPCALSSSSRARCEMQRVARLPSSTHRSLTPNRARCLLAMQRVDCLPYSCIRLTPHTHTNPQITPNIYQCRFQRMVPSWTSPRVCA
jgi:hypothetical protein